METILYADVQSTRDYLQDIAKIVGKVQQIFLPPDPNYWHMGLEMTDAAGLPHNCCQMVAGSPLTYGTEL